MATGHDIAMGLRAAYWAMHRQTDARFAKHGVTADQFVLLALLAEQDGVTQQELVHRASSDPNTVRAMLVLLESRGLIARRRNHRDRRARSVTMTRKGRQTLGRLWAESEPLRERLLAVFRADETDTLVDFLVRISEVMAQAGHRRGRPRSTASTATPTVKAKRLLKGKKRCAHEE